jgi:transforming growth factor-beta-induced protein
MKMKKLPAFKIASLSMMLLFSTSGLKAQTNVYDDVIATSPNHTSLATALQQEGLDVALQNSTATFTVFAPDNLAFDNLASALGTDIAGLLLLPDLSDILLYHVLGVTAPAANVSNGQIETSLNTLFSVKLTKTSTGDVYANQAMVTTPDLTADNGVVHSVNSVLLPRVTVVDIAIDNNFTTLTAAIIKAELLPSLTNPLAEFTVFAPTNDAFDDLALALGTDLNGILALPNLADVLLYHVVAGTVLSTGLTDGLVPTLEGNDVLVSITPGVTINNANVTTADVPADNGVVHIIDNVLLPGTASIDEIIKENIAVFPNPSSDEIRFNAAANSNYEIINMNGTSVKNGTSLDGKVTISELEQGNYIIRISDGEKVSLGKFVKM